MNKWSYIENILIYLAIVAITVGGLYFGGGWWGLVSLILLTHINNTR